MMMVIEVIYLDLVFLLNFIYDFLLLITTGVVLKKIFSLKKIFFASFFGAFSIILLFIDFNNLVLFFLKIFISFIMVYISFGKKKILTSMVYLYMNSVILAGFLYYLTIEFSYDRSGIVFFKNSFNVNYVVLIFFAPTILFVYFKQIKLLKEKINMNLKIKIYFDEKNFVFLSGFIDSGNKLKDPISGKHVIILSDIKKIKKFLINPIYVPFRAVNKSGLIRCYKIKYVEVGEKILKNYLIGVSDELIDLNGSDCILSYKFMEDINV